ncbi:MAG: GNAT family N-acetyltransferase, partial [Zavarzinella sp.]|nr:GNAT family N-acetyltransferase [Zavarzinella sp.]
MPPQLHPPATETVCREILDVNDPILPAVQALYEATLDEDERIPWQWLARTPERRASWRPGQRRAHLVVATPRDEPDRPVGFGYGAFLPGYGGYLCYLGVDPAARGRGTGTQLFRFLFGLIESAARISAIPLPFIIWESHRPDNAALWAARLRVFDKVGGLWVRGIELHTPNFMRDDAPPVRLQIFLRPTDEPAGAFDAERLRRAVLGLYDQIYRIDPDDPLYQATESGAVNPRLVPAVEALEVPLSPEAGERGE